MTVASIMPVIMSVRTFRCWIIATLVFKASTGCATIDSRRMPSAAGVVTRYVPPADRFIKSVLLDFESSVDKAFVDAAGQAIVPDPMSAGGRVLEWRGGDIKLGPLLRGREFPGNWDLIGFRVYAGHGVNIRASLVAGDGGVVVRLADAFVGASRWQTVWLETDSLRSTTRPTSVPALDDLRLRVQTGDAVVLIDDVMLAQSRMTLAESTSPRTGEVWRVDRAGAFWRATLGGREVARIPAAAFVEGGFSAREASSARVVFDNPAGETLSIDRLGRATRNAAAAPASIEIVDGAARVDRNQPGDRDNDGFDEVRNCFTIRASGDRLTARLTGRDASGEWPVLEIVGLRPGDVSVWMQGEVVPFITRTSTGAVVVELPIRTQRAVDVQLRVR